MFLIIQSVVFIIQLSKVLSLDGKKKTKKTKQKNDHPLNQTGIVCVSQAMRGKKVITSPKPCCPFLSVSNATVCSTQSTCNALVTY